MGTSVSPWAPARNGQSVSGADRGVPVYYPPAAPVHYGQTVGDGSGGVTSQPDLLDRLLDARWGGAGAG